MYRVYWTQLPAQSPPGIHMYLPIEKLEYEPSECARDALVK